MEHNHLSDKVADALRKAAVELEEFQVQFALGKAEAKDKYEEVKNFKLSKNKQGVYTIDMVKNGEIKKYQFQDTNNGKEIANYLMQISNGEERKN